MANTTPVSRRRKVVVQCTIVALHAINGQMDMAEAQTMELVSMLIDDIRDGKETRVMS